MAKNIQKQTKPGKPNLSPILSKHGPNIILIVCPMDWNCQEFFFIIGVGYGVGGGWWWCNGVIISNCKFKTVQRAERGQYLG